MKRIILFVLILGFSLELSDEDSECVRATPTSPEECYSLTPEKIHQTCCYFEGRYYDRESGQYKSGPSCLEAYKSDVNTGKTKQKLKKRSKQEHIGMVILQLQI